MGMDLSYLEQLMGGEAAGPSDSTGGVWVVSPDGNLDAGLQRLVGKARVVADALGAYVYLLLAGSAERELAERAIRYGADHVLLAGGSPALDDLVSFFEARSPQVVLFPRSPAGRLLGPGLAQLLGGGLAGYAAELTVDPIYQRLVAHQPVLDDQARQAIGLLASPAVAVVETDLLPAAYEEPWRTGQVEETGKNWAPPPEYPAVDLPAAPVTLASAPLLVAAGSGLRDAAGFALAARLAQALGGSVAGDVSALDAGWIDREQLVDATGQSVAPRVYLALGVAGDTTHLMAMAGAGTIVAVQPDPTAPITRVADWNVLADPRQFAAALLRSLGN